MNCLINETEVRGVYSMHRINLWQDDTPMGTRTVDISMGDDEHIENHISPRCQTSECKTQNWTADYEMERR